MSKGTILKNILRVTISNISTIVSGVVVGFLLPKILSVGDYGWYKTFTLYMTYAGFFSLGIIDGIVLKYGGYDYDAIDKQTFRAVYKWYVIVHVVFACIIDGIAVFTGDVQFRIILLLISVNMIAVNITGYFQQISQITQRFKEYSRRRIIQSVLNIFVVCVLYGVYTVSGKADYVLYLMLYVSANAGLAIWYVFTYRDIVFGRSLSLSTTKKEVLELGRTGFPLLFANLCSTLILTLDSQFVNLLFDTSVYAKYAFAYNVLALVTVVTSAMSAVLYPTLKRTTKEMMKGNYINLISIVTIIVFGALSLYFPLCMFIKWYLPQYEESIEILMIVFPGLALSSPITVIMHNFYKTEGENLLYFKKSLVVLMCSAIANGIAYVIFHSTKSISIASIVTMFFWYFYVDNYLLKKYSYSGMKNVVYIGIMMVVFYLTAQISNLYIGFAIYTFSFVAVAALTFRYNFKSMFALLLR